MIVPFASCERREKPALPFRPAGRRTAFAKMLLLAASIGLAAPAALGWGRDPVRREAVADSSNPQTRERVDSILNRTYAGRLIKGGFALIFEMHQKAIAEFDTAISIDPGRYEAYYLRGKEELTLKRYDLAERDFDASIRISPYNYQGYDGKGRIRLEQVRPLEAIGWFRMATWVDSGHYEPYEGLAMAFSRSQKNDSAILAYREAIGLCAGSRDSIHLAELWGGLGITYSFDKQNDLAIDALTTAISMDSTKPMPFMYRAIANASLERPDDAEIDLRNYVRQSDGDVASYTNCSAIYEMMGKHQQAAESITKAIGLGGSDEVSVSSLLIRRSWIYDAMGETEKAGRDRKAARKLKK